MNFILTKLIILGFALGLLTESATANSELIRKIVHLGRRCIVSAELYVRHDVQASKSGEPLVIGARVQLPSPISRAVTTAVVMATAEEFVPLSQSERARSGATGSIKVICGSKPCFIEQWGNEKVELKNSGYLMICNADADVEEIAELLNELKRSGLTSND